MPNEDFISPSTKENVDPVSRTASVTIKQDGNVPSRRHILGSKIFKEQLLEKFGKKIFFKKKIFDFFSKKSIF